MASAKPKLTEKNSSFLILHSSFKKLLAVLNKEPMLGLGGELTPCEVEDRSVCARDGLRC